MHQYVPLEYFENFFQILKKTTFFFGSTKLSTFLGRGLPAVPSLDSSRDVGAASPAGS